MGSIKALTMAGMIAFGAIAPAAAADLLPPPPPVEAPIIASVDTSGWYLRGDVGVGVNTMTNLRSTFQATDLAGNPYTPPPLTKVNNAIGDSGVIDFGVGYQFNNWFRADATIGYHSAASYRMGYLYPAAACGGVGINYCTDYYTAQISAVHGLVNGYVDLGTWWGVTPYVGAGVGLASVKFASLIDFGQGTGVAADKTSTNFAWALMAGLGYDVNERLKLEMGYRYLNMGKATSGAILCNVSTGCAQEQQVFTLASHDMRIGMRWMLGERASGAVLASNAPLFGGPAIASRPGPLVRKY